MRVFILGLILLALSACAHMRDFVRQEETQPNQVFSSEPQQPQRDDTGALQLRHQADHPELAETNEQGNEQVDERGGGPANDLTILLHNELRFRRDPGSIIFADCIAAARDRHNYDLGRYCLHQARRLRDMSSDLALAHLLLELEPDNPEAYTLLAESRINAEDYIKALEVLNQSDDLGFAPDLAVPAIRAVFLYGDDMLGLVQRYRDFIRIKPHRLRLLIGEAVLLSRRMEQFYFIGRYQQALTATNEIFALSRREAFLREENRNALALENVYITRARSLVQLKREQQAIESLKDVAAQHPEYLLAQLELLQVYLRVGEHRQCRELARDLIRAHPMQDELIMRIGLLVADSSLHRVQTQVREHFLHRSRSAPTRQERETALYRLSQLAAAGGDTNAQLGYLEGIRETDDLVLISVRQRAELIGTSQGPEAARRFYATQMARHTSLARRIQLSQGYWLSNINRDEAVKYVTGLLEERGNDEELLYMRGFFHALDGDVPAMERDFSKILAVNPLHVDTLNAYGYTLVDLTTRTNEGLALISRAFALESERPAIVDSLAWAYFRRGETRRALVLIQWAYARSQDPEIAAHYGEILWTLGYKDEAHALLDRDRREHPDNSVIQDTWQRLFSE